MLFGLLYRFWLGCLGPTMVWLGLSLQRLFVTLKGWWPTCWMCLRVPSLLLLRGHSINYVFSFFIHFDSPSPCLVWDQNQVSLGRLLNNDQSKLFLQYQNWMQLFISRILNTCLRSKVQGTFYAGNYICALICIIFITLKTVSSVSFSIRPKVLAIFVFNIGFEHKPKTLFWS